MRLLLLVAAGTLAVCHTATAQVVRVVPIGANDLAFSPLTNRLYASVPANNTIVEIDPATGAVGPSVFVGSQPNRIVASDTGEFLYVALDGAARIARVRLPARTVDLQFTLGSDSSFGPYYVGDMAVLPGGPNALAVARRYTGGGHGGVAIFDNGVPRPTATPSFTGSTVIEPSNSATRLYGYNSESTEFGFRRMNVDATGVTVLDVTPGLIQFFGTDIEYDSGRVYSSVGAVIDPEALTLVGTFPGIPFRSLVEPYAAAHAVYFLTGDFGSAFTLRTFNADTFVQNGTLALPGISGTPSSLVRYGSVGLAFRTTANQVVLVPFGATTPSLPEVTITSPTADPFFTAPGASISLSGDAGAINGVASVAWSTDRGFSGNASGTIQWFANDIPLIAGSNLVTITVTDNLGFTSTDTLSVFVPSLSYYLAEGATGPFFDLDLAIANPNPMLLPVSIRYLKENGTTVDQNLTLAPTSRTTIRVDEVPGVENTAVSTVLTTSRPIVVERTMRWDDVKQYGSHTEKAVSSTAREWYFAEGAQGFFYTYLLLVNPNATANTATVDWLREGAAPVRRVYPLAALSRTTIDAGADAALVGRSFGIAVTFEQPGAAERTMYFGTPPDLLFKGGHASAGVNGPSTTWFLAEGATGAFFETFILLANPNAAPATATLTFLPASGSPVVRTVTISGRGRKSVNIEALEPAAPQLASVAVATSVTASLPIIVERSQYWPYSPAEWYEAHNSFGLTATGLRWGLAEGRVGNPAGFPAADYQTYILLANPGDTTADVTVAFLRTDSTTILKTFHVPPASRRNVAVTGPAGDVPELANETFGALVTSSRPIAVERAMYGSPSGQVFGSGTNATATRLP